MVVVANRRSVAMVQQKAPALKMMASKTTTLGTTASKTVALKIMVLKVTVTKTMLMVSRGKPGDGWPSLTRPKPEANC